MKISWIRFLELIPGASKKLSVEKKTEIGVSLLFSFRKTQHSPISVPKKTQSAAKWAFHCISFSTLERMEFHGFC
jgi:hypothetical protein